MWVPVRAPLSHALARAGSLRGFTCSVAEKTLLSCFQSAFRGVKPSKSHRFWFFFFSLEVAIPVQGEKHKERSQSSRPAAGPGGKSQHNLVIGSTGGCLRPVSCFAPVPSAPLVLPHVRFPPGCLMSWLQAEPCPAAEACMGWDPTGTWLGPNWDVTGTRPGCHKPSAACRWCSWV